MTGTFTEEEKIGITVGVIFSVLVVGAIGAVIYWRKLTPKHRKERSSSPLTFDEIMHRYNSTPITHQQEPTLQIKTNAAISNPPSSSPNVRQGASHTPLFVTRLDEKAHLEGAQNKAYLNQSMNQAKSSSSRIPGTISSALLPDTHIDTSSEYTNIEPPAYRSILWPDVIDPYHRRREVESSIGFAVLGINSEPL